MDPATVSVPSSLPDSAEVRSDFLDYAYAIERFDRDLGGIIALLKERGELENTLIIVTSDNGMPFPRFKANCYEYGIHIPLAVQWPEKIPKGQVLQTLTSLVDLTPTIYEAAGVPRPPGSLFPARACLRNSRRRDRRPSGRPSSPGGNATRRRAIIRSAIRSERFARRNISTSATSTGKVARRRSAGLCVTSVHRFRRAEECTKIEVGRVCGH